MRKRKTEVMQMDAKLMGYVRKSRNGKAIKISVAREAFESAKTYRTKNGDEYVDLVIRLEKLMEVVNGNAEVTAAVHFE